MKRQIIKIDSDKCIGCGLCVQACHEGAIGMVDGKAALLRDDYCDGLGNCLPVCPTDAISFEERDAAPFDAEKVKRNMEESRLHAGGCPGSRAMDIKPNSTKPVPAAEQAVSELRQWPVQIKLAPINAQYFDGADLLVAADCTAYAYGGFHSEFMRGRITVIGCPKLDGGDYSEKLTAILAENNIKSVTVARMEVPCCGGLESAVKTALKDCGKMIPWQRVTISTDGRILS